MGKSKNRKRSKPRSLTKRLADDPQKTSKAEWKKMGWIGKGVTATFLLSLASSQWANEINALPVVGRWLRPITAASTSLRSRVR